MPSRTPRPSDAPATTRSRARAPAVERYPPATEFFPARPSLTAFARSVQTCRACPLYRRATQAVFGEGPKRAALMLVGEQPGDQEDRRGKPFVGPAGALLDKVLAEVGIDRDRVFVTNSVKHFKWKETRGKRRIHEKPGLTEVQACLPWLQAELELVRPDVVVCLGSTAAQSLLGRSFRLTKQRGELLASPLAPRVLATYHPSAILRARDDDRRRLRAELAEDIARAAEHARAISELHASGDGDGRDDNAR